MNVIVRIIAQYLDTHKRLVIPGLGMFLVKEEPRKVVFTELMSRDDGVLQALLVEQGMTALAAAGELSRFVFEVRHAIESGREFEMQGFGVLRPAGNGTMRFDHRPLTTVLPDVALEIEPEQVQKVRHVERIEEPRRPVQSAQQAAEESKEEPKEEPKEEAADEEEEEEEIQTEADPDEPIEDHDEEQHETDDEDPFMEEDDEDELPQPRRVRRVARPTQQKPKVDRFLLVAIVAAVLALLAIGYGMYSNSMSVEETDETPTEQTDSLAVPMAQ